MCGFALGAMTPFASLSRSGRPMSAGCATVHSRVTFQHAMEGAESLRFALPSPAAIAAVRNGI